MSNLELFVHTASAIAVIIVTARLVGSLMVYLKQPRVVGEMIAGVLLGPTLFSTVWPQAAEYLFKPTQSNIYLLGNFGLSFYMFLVGLEIDFSKVNSAIRKQAAVLSSVATVVPFAVGCFSAYIFFDKLSLPGVSLASFMLFTGTVFSITAFPMLARILDEKNLIKTTLGTLSLLSASIQDVVTWILLAFITAIASTGKPINGIITLGGAFAFIALVNFAGKPLLKKLGDKVGRQGSMNQNQFAIVVVSLIVSAIITDMVGLYSVFGGFILGLGMPRNEVFQREVKTKMQDMMIIFLLPLFFAFSGLKTNFLVIFSPELAVPSLIILFLSFAGKLLPVTLSMKAVGYDWRQSTAIGGLVNSRGLMELIVANIGLDYKIIDGQMYSIIVLIAVVTTVSAMPIYNTCMKKSVSIA